MSDAWQVTVTFDEPGAAEVVRAQIAVHVRQRLGPHAGVSVIDPHLYLRTGTRDSAVAAEEVIRRVLAARDLSATVVTRFWDPSINRWINLADPVPDDIGLTLTLDKQRHGAATQVAADAGFASATGLATWQVRVNLPSHHDAVTFARQLKAQGHPPVRRWRHLLVGARNQDEARALAAAIHAQAPPGWVISVLRVPGWMLSAALNPQT